jgi:hypothetical protein
MLYAISEAAINISLIGTTTASNRWETLGKIPPPNAKPITGR